MPHALWPRNQNILNRNNIVTNSIRPLKMVQIKNIKKKKKRERERKERDIGCKGKVSPGEKGLFCSTTRKNRQLLLLWKSRVPKGTPKSSPPPL